MKSAAANSARCMDCGVVRAPFHVLMLADQRIVEWMCAAAEKNRIPYQREVLEDGSTDARAIQLTRSGVPAGCLSIPCRYGHTPSEMVDYGDVQNSVKLLVALLSAPVDL